MSEPKETGGPAFPQPATSHGHACNVLEGMTLRDWFAGQALAGVLAAADGPKSVNDVDTFIASASASAYVIADAMLKARAK